MDVLFYRPDIVIKEVESYSLSLKDYKFSPINIKNFFEGLNI